MNEELIAQLTDRFTLDEIADAANITYPMFLDAFHDEVLEGLEVLSEIDQGFTFDLTNGEEE